MDSARGPRITGITGDNSDGNPKKKRTPSAKSLANLKPFQPGQSGNPSGRPKGTLSDKMRWKLQQPAKDSFGQPDPHGRDNGDLFVDSVWRKAVQGSVPAADLIWNRMEGRIANPNGQGETVPGTLVNSTQVNVNVSTEATAQVQQVETAEQKGARLAARMRDVYGLDEAYSRNRAAVASAVSGTVRAG
jgi:hypothetical protein